jgi:hypothetical protein
MLLKADSSFPVKLYSETQAIQVVPVSHPELLVEEKTVAKDYPSEGNLTVNTTFTQQLSQPSAGSDDQVFHLGKKRHIS